MASNDPMIDASSESDNLKHCDTTPGMSHVMETRRMKRKGEDMHPPAAIAPKRARLAKNNGRPPTPFPPIAAGSSPGSKTSSPSPLAHGLLTHSPAPKHDETCPGEQDPSAAKQLIKFGQATRKTDRRSVPVDLLKRLRDEVDLIQSEMEVISMIMQEGIKLQLEGMKAQFGEQSARMRGRLAEIEEIVMGNVEQQP